MKLAVDRTRCDGHGLCAVLMADRITRDEWGFPVIHEDRVDRSDGAASAASAASAVRAAVAACPALALYLDNS